MRYTYPHPKNAKRCSKPGYGLHNRFPLHPEMSRHYGHLRMLSLYNHQDRHFRLNIGASFIAPGIFGLGLGIDIYFQHLKKGWLLLGPGSLERGNSCNHIYPP